MTTNEILLATGHYEPWENILLTVLLVGMCLTLAFAVRLILRPALSAKPRVRLYTGATAAVILVAYATILLNHYDREDTKAAEAKEHFGYTYGLKLTDEDIRQLRDVDVKDITLRPDTGHGTDQDIQFRSVGGEVLPFHQATDEWEEVPVTAQATADADAKAEAEAEADQEVIEVPAENGDSQ